jgi:hypothetical protein
MFAALLARYRAESAGSTNDRREVVWVGGDADADGHAKAFFRPNLAATGRRIVLLNCLAILGRHQRLAISIKLERPNSPPMSGHVSGTQRS